MGQKSDSILVVGLGKLGLPLAAAMASRGFQVTGYDQDSKKIEQLKRGTLHFELNLESVFKQAKTHLNIASQISSIQDAQFIFVIVPTPSNRNGSFSLRYLKKGLSQIGKLLRGSRGFPIVSIVSTVLPGDMDQLKALLEQASGKECGKGFGLCYNPAFVALGNVIQNFMSPDFILIGESDAKSGHALEQFYSRFCLNQPKVCRMNFVNAELTKIALNTYVTMKISFGNTLARMCEKLDGADASTIVAALGNDARINTKYLKGALGYGGPCFPRDNKAFSSVARKAGVQAFSAEATDKTNRKQTEWVANLISSEADSHHTIAILGLSYKEGTDVIEASQGIELANFFANQNRNVIVYDPQAMESAKRALQERVTYGDSLEACLKTADVIVIATPWSQFAKITEKQLSELSTKRKVIIDCWRVIKNKNFSSKVKYFELGKTWASHNRLLVEAIS